MELLVSGLVELSAQGLELLIRGLGLKVVGLGLRGGELLWFS